MHLSQRCRPFPLAADATTTAVEVTVSHMHLSQRCRPFPLAADAAAAAARDELVVIGIPIPRFCGGCWNLHESVYLQKPLFFQWQHTSGLLPGDCSEPGDLPPPLRGDTPGSATFTRLGGTGIGDAPAGNCTPSCAPPDAE